MPTILVYILKLSISLSVVYLFYYFILRRLTFYNWNRWYLLIYPLVCFLIPFIDLSTALSAIDSPAIYEWVPVIEPSLHSVSTPKSVFSFSDGIVFVFAGGAIVMLVRLGLQLFSFRRMVRKATLLSSEIVNIYKVDEPVIPFSFGRSVFLNPGLHTHAELQEIILHEFIHVKERHSVDIIFAELLCLVNWYNPFAWMIRSAIRQNLEFAADEQVIQNGVNKKEYQYLLLKVIGNNQYSIAQKFNFTSLKKRIAMMNKNKSARRNLIRFLFVLPVISVILLSFRKEFSLAGDSGYGSLFQSPVKLNDTLPRVSINEKGYLIDIVDNKGNCMVVVRDQKGKEVKRLLLTEWNANKDTYRKMYGEILPPLPPIPPLPGEAVSAPLPPLPPLNSIQAGTPVSGAEPAWSANYTEYEITKTKAVFRSKDGKTEKYDLTKPAEKAAFEKKFGSNTQIYLPSIAVPAPPALPASPSVVSGPAAIPSPALEDIGYAPSVIDPPVIKGDDIVNISITPATTEAELEKYQVEMKQKGVNLTYFDIIFHNGKLIKLTGKMETKSRISNFSAIDFKLLTLGVTVDDKQVWTKVNVVRN